jgi:hypothetical protein
VATPRLSALLPAIVAALVAAPARAQTLEVTPDATRVTVGDPITLHVAPRLPPGATPLDRVPTPAGALPEGFRILSSDSLARTPDGRFEARLKVAFFRPGKQSVPPLALAYAAASGTPGDTLRSQPVPIEVVPILPAGNQVLRDIKDLARVPRPSRWPVWLALAAGLLVAVAAALWIRRRLRRRAPAPAPAPAVEPLLDLRTPYERALERLAAVERSRLPERGELARHYELVTDALRRYLEESGAVPALELTTAELAYALPPGFAERGLRERCVRLLEEADLVKFARLVPSGEAAARLLRGARDLLDGWEAAAAVVLPTGAQGDGTGPGAAASSTTGPSPTSVTKEAAPARTLRPWESEVRAAKPSNPAASGGG